MWRTGLLIALAAAACGRVGFDPVALVGPGDGMGPVDAPGDASPDAAPAPACDQSADFGTPVELTELSASTIDVTLRLEANELSGVFWSVRTGNAEVFRATRPDLASAFTVAQLTDLGSTSTDLDPAVSRDGSFVVLGSSRPGGAGSSDLYEAQASGSGFLPPVLLSSISTGFAENQPNFTRGDTIMYFASDRGGTANIYRSTRTGPAAYSAPELVTELVNAGQAHTDPTPSADDLTLYFASTTGAPAANDIYVATRATTAEPFGLPKLVMSVSSTVQEGPSWLSPDGCRLYLSSTRSGVASIFVASR